MPSHTNHALQKQRPLHKPRLPTSQGLPKATSPQATPSPTSPAFPTVSVVAAVHRRWLAELQNTPAGQVES